MALESTSAERPHMVKVNRVQSQASQRDLQLDVGGKYKYVPLAYSRHGSVPESESFKQGVMDQPSRVVISLFDHFDGCSDNPRMRPASRPLRSVRSLT